MIGTVNYYSNDQFKSTVIPPWWDTGTPGRKYRSWESESRPWDHSQAAVGISRARL